MNKKTIILILCVVLISSCASFLALFDDKLRLKQESFNGNQLRLDGYYYENQIVTGRNSIYFFYENGTVLSVFFALASEIEKVEYRFRNGSFYEAAKNKKERWSLFRIDDNDIKFEIWSIGEVSTCHIQEGKILNDTTFVITKSYRIKDVKKRVYETNVIYRFKAFSPKPDSTNSFIK